MRFLNPIRFSCNPTLRAIQVEPYKLAQNYSHVTIEFNFMKLCVCVSAKIDKVSTYTLGPINACACLVNVVNGPIPRPYKFVRTF